MRYENRNGIFIGCVGDGGADGCICTCSDNN